eukprot:3889626-Amphidinium_carterae.3
MRGQDRSLRASYCIFDPFFTHLGCRASHARHNPKVSTCLGFCIAVILPHPIWGDVLAESLLCGVPKLNDVECQPLKICKPNSIPLTSIAGGRMMTGLYTSCAGFSHRYSKGDPSGRKDRTTMQQSEFRR